MKRSRLFGLALMAASVFAVLLSVSAFALPEFLAEGGNTTFKGKITSGTAALETKAGNIVECAGADESGGFTSSAGGTFHFSFTSCKTPSFFNADCKSKSDNLKEILMLGSFSHVYDILGSTGTLGVSILFQPAETEYECTGLAVFKVKGTFVCELFQALTSSVTHNFECLKGVNRGEQKVKAYYNDGGTLVSTLLLTSLNGGTFEESNVQVKETITTPTNSVFMNE